MAWTRHLEPDERDASVGERIARSWVATRRARATRTATGWRSRWRAPALAFGAMIATGLVAVPLLFLMGAPPEVDVDALLRAYGDAMHALPAGSP